MQIIDFIQTQVEQLPNQPLHFQHQSFTFDDATQSWQPARIPSGEFPLLLGDVFRINFTEDLRLKTWSLSLVYLEPHLPDTSDVPDAHRRAEAALIELLARLEAFEEVVIASPPELSFFWNQTEARLAGANLLVQLKGANTPAPCC